MSRLLLHFAEASPPSRAVLMLSDILGLKLELQQTKLLELEHKSPAFRKINPMGTVPVLQDGDFTVSESHAIMKYLLTKYGEGHSERLYPSEVKTRALVDQALFFDTGVFFIALKEVALPTLLHGLPGPTPQNKDKIDEGYSALEGFLAQSQYLAGDHITLADLSVGSTATALQPIHKLDGNRFPRASKWLKRIQEEPVFKNFNEPGTELFGKILQKFWAINSAKKL